MLFTNRTNSDTLFPFVDLEAGTSKRADRNTVYPSKVTIILTNRMEKRVFLPVTGEKTAFYHRI